MDSYYGKGLYRLLWPSSKRTIKLCLDNGLKETTLDNNLISILQSDDYTGFIRYYGIIKNQNR